jgi:hypothetical protein
MRGRLVDETVKPLPSFLVQLQGVRALLGDSVSHFLQYDVVILHLEPGALQKGGFII